MRNDRVITHKNYILYFMFILIVIVLSFYISAWIRNYNSIKTSVSYLEGKTYELNLNELQVSISEMNEAIVYIGYNGNSNIYKLEKDIYKKIKKENLLNNFVYINVSNYDNYEEVLINELGNGIDKIQAPLIIYFKNSFPVKVINSNNKKIISVNELNELIEFYDLGDN
jgi:hypothetical protein